ncbi:hypothetical protein IG631_08091 [Alternaria alternata]|nr:hypothetical protein IG631_08091 [Alternaria alternata]
MRKINRPEGVLKKRNMCFEVDMLLSGVELSGHRRVQDVNTAPLMLSHHTTGCEIHRAVHQSNLRSSKRRVEVPMPYTVTTLVIRHFHIGFYRRRRREALSSAKDALLIPGMLLASDRRQFCRSSVTANLPCICERRSDYGHIYPLGSR